MKWFGIGHIGADSFTLCLLLDPEFQNYRILISRVYSFLSSHIVCPYRILLLQQQQLLLLMLLLLL